MMGGESWEEGTLEQEEVGQVGFWTVRKLPRLALRARGSPTQLGRTLTEYTATKKEAQLCQTISIPIRKRTENRTEQKTTFFRSAELMETNRISQDNDNKNRHVFRAWIEIPTIIFSFINREDAFT